MDEKIKDIYDCKKINGTDPLVIWHNQVIEKHVDELTVSDVARCIRQNLFLDSAYEMLLVYLLHNPYEGDVYEGELMDKASEINHKYIMNHEKTISEVLANAYHFIKTHEWECEADKKEYEDTVNKLAEMMKK